MSGHNDDARSAKFAVLLALLGVVAAACAGTSERIEGFRKGRLQTRATSDLKRGMNFGDAMDAPNEGEWGWTISSTDFQAVRAAGFDHVRVPMRISSHADVKAPYAIEKRFLHRMDWAVDQALSNDLGIIVDMHHYIPMMKAPKAHADRLVGLWRQIATHLPKILSLEVARK